MAKTVQFYKSTIPGKAKNYSQAHENVICFDLSGKSIYLEGVVIGEANEACKSVVKVLMETEGPNKGQLKVEYSNGESSYIELPNAISSIEEGVAISVTSVTSTTSPKIGVKIAKDSAINVNSDNELDIFWTED